MSDRSRHPQFSGTLSPSQWRWVDEVASHFERAIQDKLSPRIAEFLEGAQGPQRRALLLKLIRTDWELLGQGRRLESYLTDWPELASDPFAIECLLEFECRCQWEQGDEPALEELQARFPNVSRERLRQMSSGDSQAGAGAPAKIGPYVIEKKLGSGGFGIVYLGHDEQLQRRVAIKVPGPKLLATAAAREAFLREARAAANLRHDAIVRVIGFGGEQDADCFIAYEFIDGIDLHSRLKQGRLPHDRTAELVATVAEALHHAHQQGVYHRDIKPHNILLDGQGRPYVADFGLAIREDERAAHRGKLAGTLDYMAPEQVRGEGHKIDGRTDLFGLGVVLYEMLCGRRPFVAGPAESLAELIQEHDPRPPRALDDSIPKELERICLKALSRRKIERYQTGSELAEELRLVVAALRTAPAGAARRLHQAVGVPINTTPTLIAPEPAPAAPLPAATTPTAGATPAVWPDGSSDEPVRIVPKGLRSFDEQDQDFFLELLPGPRDRLGLPETLRFWISRLERRDAESGAAVALIYGPSGCGKSSLVKAGLLPRLASGVRAVYIEATRDDTETRLLRALDRLSSYGVGSLFQVGPPVKNRSESSPADLKKTPDPLASGSLPDRIAALRRGEAQPNDTKVVIVLDQFEQWLHAHALDLERTDLLAALRQADNRHVQFVLLVRDDFWLAVSRLFAVLEIPLVEGLNVQCVDLFDLRHARHVLTLFGQAYRCLPERSKEITADQHRFLDRAVEGLAQDGRVISVRLSLFADMLKSKPWTPQSLTAVGGTEGVGVTFLEETFSSRTANPEHRSFEKPVRAVLAALLPETGTDIKGRLRSRDELLHAAELPHTPKRFDRLLEILDRELRIITPTEVEGDSQPTPSAPGVGERGGVSPPLISRACQQTGGLTPPGSPESEMSTMFYQLAHDYLVPPLRDWLTRKRRETWRGRAELRLEDRTTQWLRSREARHLPTPPEFVSILCGVPRRRRSSNQRKLVRAATRWYGSIAALLLVVLGLLGGTAWELNGRAQGRRIVQAILGATPDRLAEPIDDHLPAYRRWADRALRAVADDEREAPARRLRASLALLPVDAARAPALCDRLLDVPFEEFPILRDRLEPHAASLLERLWHTLHDSGSAAAARFRAGLALATYAPPPNGLNPDSVVARSLDRATGPTAGLPHVERSADRSTTRLDPPSPHRGRGVGGEGAAPSTTAAPVVARSPDRATDPHVERSGDRSTTKAGDRSTTNTWTAADFVFLAGQLVATNPDYQRALRSHLHPIRPALLDPLATIFGDEKSRDTLREAAAAALADFGHDQPRPLSEWMSSATPEQFGILWPVVSQPQLREAVVEKLTEIVQSQPGMFEYTGVEGEAVRRLTAAGRLIVEPDEVQWDEAARVALGRRRAGAAASLLRLGEARAAFDGFQFDDDPESLTQFHARVKPRLDSASRLIDALTLATDVDHGVGSLFQVGPQVQNRSESPQADLKKTPDPFASRPGQLSERSRVRFGLLLALGDYTFDELPANRRDALRDTLRDWFRNDPSSAIHGATRWVLKTWGFDKEVTEAERRAVPYDATREWFIVGVPPSGGKGPAEAGTPASIRDYLTFIVIPAGTYFLGSPAWEEDRDNDEAAHIVHLTRPFAISEREVTVGLWQRFETATGKQYGYSEPHSPTAEHPVNAPQWYWCAEFCRWLGQATGLNEDEQCYDDPTKHPKGKDGYPDNWPLRLDRRGFRLPTEAEWEVACRAGMASTFGFGNDRTLLPRHAWFLDNEGKKSHAGGELRPNLRGLADMHGNLFEWCHDGYSSSRPVEATDPVGGDESTNLRVLRGGSWFYNGRLTRAADRLRNSPDYRNTYYGFRVVCVFGVRTP